MPYRLIPLAEQVLRIAEKHTDRQTAERIAQDANPVLVNQTNQEPWYRSRVIQGLLITAIGSAARILDLPIGGDETVLIVNGFAAAMEFGGIIWALYGRLSTKPALGE
ncbi:hypothetical protein [Pelagibacterium lentulum]|uniref:Uncharacterized protein n=1 Tax=Pelagibacterium lentulum TaxID=2029865 RepID=A0A916RAH4_9HYPH|nr:hypothetical protein [Pelagibacterium lentulum]GGA45769.1 hypothetical protein GCM10011499_14370 [Pelagibacterium lentulum]